MATGDDLHLPYPTIVLEYSFSDCSRLGDDRMLIAKRVVVCMEFDACQDSYFGRQARKMLGDSVNLPGSLMVVPIFFVEGLWMPYPFACVVTVDRSGGGSGLVYSENGRRVESSVGYCTFPINQAHSLEMIREHGVKGAYEISMSDVAEEVFVLLGLCVSLTCSNVGIIETSTPEKLNKKRARNGKLPFFSYKQIVIHPAPTAKRASSADHFVEGRQSPRLHHRRGHVRNLRGGVKRVWVSPAMVGSGTKGFVKSSYRVGG